MTLGALHAAIPRIKLDGSNPLRTTYVLKRWSDMRLQYEQYDTKVSYSTANHNINSEDCRYIMLG